MAQHKKFSDKSLITAKRMNNLQKFTCKTDNFRFVDFVRMLVVHKGQRETDEQKIIFASLDVDNDGVLSKTELVAALKGDRQGAEDILKMVGKDDEIDYSEWLMATGDKLSWMNLKFAFQYFDKQRTGLVG